MNDQGALFRYGDPDTSRSAAQAIPTHELEQEILAAFVQHEQLTDDELVDVLDDSRYPPTVKTARSRLTRADCLRDTGIRRNSRRGRAMIVWEMTP